MNNELQQSYDQHDTITNATQYAPVGRQLNSMSGLLLLLLLLYESIKPVGPIMVVSNVNLSME